MVTRQSHMLACARACTHRQITVLKLPCSLSEKSTSLFYGLYRDCFHFYLQRAPVLKPHPFDSFVYISIFCVFCLMFLVFLFTELLSACLCVCLFLCESSAYESPGSEYNEITLRMLRVRSLTLIITVQSLSSINENP